jgi:branched-chain amino acid transport system substrate-binding protein
MPTHLRTLAVCAAIMGGVATLRPASADILIGMSAPINGDNALVGAQLSAGAETAVADFNLRGGVLGEKLVLQIEDDGCNARRAVPVANKLIAQKVGFVLGGWCSGVDLPASSIFADNGTVEISLASNEAITEQGFDGLFRINGRNDRQGKLLADFIATHHSGQRVALVSDRSAYAIGLIAHLRSALKAQAGVVVALDQSIDAGTKDFSALVAGFKDTAIDVVTFVGYPTEAGLIVAQATAAGLKAEFVSGNSMGNRKFWDVAGKAGQGLVFTCPTAVDLLPSAQDTVTEFKSKGKTADGYTLYAYAGVQLLADAITRAKSTNPETVAGELQKGGIPTVLGNISFDDKGDILQPIWRLCRWSEGSYAYYSAE